MNKVGKEFQVCQSQPQVADLSLDTGSHGTAGLLRMKWLSFGTRPVFFNEVKQAHWTLCVDRCFCWWTRLFWQAHWTLLTRNCAQTSSRRRTEKTMPRFRGTRHKRNRQSRCYLLVVFSLQLQPEWQTVSSAQRNQLQAPT